MFWVTRETTTDVQGQERCLLLEKEATPALEVPPEWWPGWKTHDQGTADEGAVELSGREERRDRAACYRATADASWVNAVAQSASTNCSWRQGPRECGMKKYGVGAPRCGVPLTLEHAAFVAAAEEGMAPRCFFL